MRSSFTSMSPSPVTQAELPEQDYDGAEPAPTSIAVANLLRLAALAEPGAAEGLRERAGQAIAAFQERLGEAALAVPQLCCSAHLFACGPPSQGPPGGPPPLSLIHGTQLSVSPSVFVRFGGLCL